MKQETIVQFVCFTTDLGMEEFAPELESRTGQFKNSNTKTMLYRMVTGNKNSFSYISKFEWPENEFQFVFKNDGRSGRFSEHRARALQIGGYKNIQQKKQYNKKDNDVTIIAFIHHHETNIAFYEELPFYSKLNIHQAYYENCTYGYVIEFFVQEENADAL